jgi:hypothetical protein
MLLTSKAGDALSYWRRLWLQLSGRYVAHVVFLTGERTEEWMPGCPE